MARVTETQYFPGGPWDVSKRPDGLSDFAPTQRTTSHRTGRRIRGLDVPSSLEDIVDSTGGTYAGMFHALSEDARQSAYPPGTDRGHEFDTTCDTLYLSHPNIQITEASQTGPWPRYRYRGPLVYYPASHGAYFQSGPTFDSGYYGPKAVAQTSPSKSVADLAVNLAEIYREGFPAGVEQSLEDFRSRASTARLAGEKYLEHQFGWVPLLGALTQTYTTAMNARALLDQYIRDAGRPIRRKMTFPTTVSEEAWESTGTLNTGVDIPPTAFNSMMVNGVSGGTMYETLRSQQTVKFSGAYSYFLPGGNENFLRKLERAEQEFNYLFGVRITPEVLWNLAPWSWLSDWKANLGDNIANASHLGSDGLVMRYGYLMCETITDHTFTLVGPVFKSGISGPYTMQFTRVRKQRVRATPFGFGLNPQAFSLKQWSILGALGITKGPNSLW